MLKAILIRSFTLMSLLLQSLAIPTVTETRITTYNYYALDKRALTTTDITSVITSTVAKYISVEGTNLVVINDAAAAARFQTGGGDLILSGSSRVRINLQRLTRDGLNPIIANIPANPGYFYSQTFGVSDSTLTWSNAAHFTVSGKNEVVFCQFAGTSSLYGIFTTTGASFASFAPLCTPVPVVVSIRSSSTTTAATASAS